MRDKDLEFEWMTGTPGQDELLKHVHCACKKSECKTKLCSCFRIGLSCYDSCFCTGYHNSTADSEISGNDYGSDRDSQDETVL